MSTFKNTIVITGGTTGLGYEAALSIARQRPEYQVVIASRSDKFLAATSINKLSGHDNVVYLPLDLSNLGNVRGFASDYTQRKFPPIKALLLNAGLQFPGGVEYSTDGIEKTFAINHLGHALLFYLLRPHLTSDARIVITSSGTHDPAQKTGIPHPKYVNAEELARPTPESAKNEGTQRYSTSKLCNVMWTLALHRRLSQGSRSGQKWTVTAFDPGLMPGTGLARDYSFLIRFVWNNILPHVIPILQRLFNPNIHSAKTSGGNLARLAVSNEVEGESGVYFEGQKVIKTSDLSYDEDKQEDLYAWTMKAVAKSGEEQQQFEKVYPT